MEDLASSAEPKLPEYIFTLYISCPFDSTHSVRVGGWYKHLKCCPKLRDMAFEALLPFVIPQTKSYYFTKYIENSRKHNIFGIVYDEVYEIRNKKKISFISFIEGEDYSSLYFSKKKTVPIHLLFQKDKVLYSKVLARHCRPENDEKKDFSGEKSSLTAPIEEETKDFIHKNDENTDFFGKNSLPAASIKHETTEGILKNYEKFVTAERRIEIQKILIPSAFESICSSIGVDCKAILLGCEDARKELIPNVIHGVRWKEEKDIIYVRMGGEKAVSSSQDGCRRGSSSFTMNEGGEEILRKNSLRWRAFIEASYSATIEGVSKRRIHDADKNGYPCLSGMIEGNFGDLANSWNSHDVQNANILAICIMKGLLDDAINSGGSLLVIEFGSGKGGLTRWLNFGCSKLFEYGSSMVDQCSCDDTTGGFSEENANGNALSRAGNLLSRSSAEQVNAGELAASNDHPTANFASSSLRSEKLKLRPLKSPKSNGRNHLTRFLLVEKKTMRSPREKMDVNLSLSSNESEELSRSGRIIRLRNNISRFNLGDVLRYTNLGDVSAFRRPHIPGFIKELHEVGVRLDISSIEDVSSVWSLLSKISRGGGPNINHTLDCFERSFRNKPVSHLVAAAKHLCGSATDLALKSVISSSFENVSGLADVSSGDEAKEGLRGGERKSTVSADAVVSPGGVCRSGESFKLPRRADIKASICVATCCHHSCTFEDYVGLKLLGDLLKIFSREEFLFLISMSSWATNAAGYKTRIGLMVKRILDFGRVMWLRDNGFSNATVQPFVANSISPEDVVIIATSDA